MDLSQLADNLFARKAEKEVTSNKGIANAINYIWNRHSTSRVDFSSFTYEDACHVIDVFGSVLTDEEDDNRLEDYTFTGLDYFDANEGVVVKLVRTNYALVPVEEDDFI
ncbi:hypothetical protein [Priestia koreensis]|uniref:hypothetical protein n=1 Tax=Priestia koreensis TaxID=284581 RepID=UPI001F55AB74|nr:hypothetical protein [Priestia koreensis]UNL87432.1 hypothetical protein IE339_24240 [Priestia koreensis]